MECLTKVSRREGQGAVGRGGWKFMVARAHKLTEKQKVFVAEYQKDLNATQAAIRAGYSAKNADKIGPRLVGKSRVAEAIKKEMEQRLHKVGVRADKVLTRMARIGYVDIRRLYGPNNTLLDVKDWPDEIVPAVAGVEVFEEYQGKGKDRKLVGYTKKVRLWDPNPSLTNMAKNVGAIGNGKHRDEDGDEKEQVGRPWTPLELAAKLVFYRQIIQDIVAEVAKAEEIEGQKALSGKSQDEKPKELLK